MSFIGLDKILETSADFDSATNTPARNAPIATDNPTMFANNAYDDFVTTFMCFSVDKLGCYIYS